MSCCTFSFLSRGIILWIELPQQENPANTSTQHTETLDRCFDLIRSHQQCIPWSSPLEIKPVTTECRAETLPLSPRSTSHTSDARLTSHGECVLQVTSILMSNILLWTLTHGHNSVGWQARTYLYLLHADNKCSLEDLLRAIDNWDEQRARESGIFTLSAWHDDIYIYIYIYKRIVDHP